MQSNRYSNYSGFTLIEVALVLIIIASLAVITSKFFFRDFNALTVDQTADDIALIHRAALTYYAKNNQWPDQENGCVSAVSVIGSIPGIVINSSGKAVSPWFDGAGQIVYEIQCPNTVNPSFMSVSLKLSDQDKIYLETMLIKIPLSIRSGDSTIIATVIAPSSIVALENYIKKVEVTKITGNTNLNTIEAGFNINGKVIDFEVGSCINDNKNYSGSCNIGYRTKADAIFSLNPGGVSVLGGLTLIPPDMSSPYGNDYTLNLCDSVNNDWVKDPKYLTSFDNIECVGEMKNPAWSLKVNDVFIRSDIEKQAVDTNGVVEGTYSKNHEEQYLSQASSSMLRRWIHKEHYPVKEDWNDEIDMPDCGRVYSSATDEYLYYRPVIMLRSNGKISKTIKKYIEFDYYKIDYSGGRYRKWRIDIDIDKRNSIVDSSTATVSVDTFCFTDDAYSGEPEEDEDEDES